MKYSKYLSVLFISIFATFALMFGSVHSASAGFWDWFGIGGVSQQAQVNVTTPAGNTPSAQPLITVLSPNGGETLKEGENYIIRWNSANLPMGATLNISIYRADGANKDIVTNLSSNQSEYLWKVDATSGWGFGYNKKPSMIANLFGIKTASAEGGYTIQVSANWGYGNVYDKSDALFNIVSASSSSSSTSGILTATTGGLDHLSANATVLNGTVSNPNRENVSYYFHYSKDEPSAETTETNWTSINYSSLQNVSAYISGLSSGTKYVYRLYAYSHTTGKTVSGDWKSFTTLSSSSSSSVNYSYIIVISPNGGQVMKNANTTISWSITPFSTKNFGINLLYDNGDLAANIRTCNSSHTTTTNGIDHFYNWKAGFDANNQEIPNGKYKILVYDCAGGTASGYGNAFDLISLSSSSSSSTSNPHAEWSLINTSVYGTAGVVGVASSSVTGIITLKAKAIGGSMIKPTASDFSVVFASSTKTNGFYTSANSININPVVEVTPSDSIIGEGGEYTITITGVLYSSDPRFGSSQYLLMAIKDIDSVVGGVKTENQTWGIDTFYTGLAYLSKDRNSFYSKSSSSNNVNTYRQTSNYTSSSSQEISLSQLVELFIALGVISREKANFARASIKVAQ